MASNNSTYDPSCPDHEWFVATGKSLSFAVYFVLTPFYFVVGLIGHWLCLLAFYRHSKNEEAYIYQIFVTGSETIEIFATTLYVITFQWWASPQQPGPDFYRSCYPCMWYSAHLAVPLSEVYLTMSVWFSVFMCVDRLYSLHSPVKYKDTRKNHVITAIACVTIGVSTSIFHCFRYYVRQVGSTVDGQALYEVTLDTVFTQGLTCNVLNQTRNGVRGLGLILLYCCNAGLIYKVRFSTKKTASMRSTNSQKQREEAQRNLTLLAVIQSLFITFSMSVTMAYYIGVFPFPAFYACRKLFLVPLMDATTQVVDLFDFVFLIALSKPIRRVVMQVLPGCRHNVVSSINGHCG